MRETSFIRQNKDKWAEFEQILEQKERDPEKLNELFVQITDDLSYSRTFYPNRSVRVYLNSLAQRIFFKVYRGRHKVGNRVLLFWLDELPRLMYQARRDFTLSFFVFLLAFGMGMLSSAMEPEFLRSILGDAYVDQTLENIAAGDPMAIYKDRDRLGMSVGITINNLYVSLLTFVMGLLFGVGSIALMLYNGVMIGAFQYFFIERGLFWESFLTVWTHGTLEISAIIIAGAAGITMGRGLAFPGTYSRFQSFQQSARRGLKILIGIAPIIILAGFIEGYLTRYTETPDIIRGFFIAVCLGFVLIYFVWYPRFRARMGFDPVDEQADLPPDTDRELRFDQIKGNGDLFADIFFLFRQRGHVLLRSALAAGAAYTAIAFFTTSAAPGEVFYYPDQAFGKLQVLDSFFFNDTNWIITPAFFALLALFSTAVMSVLRQERHTPVTRAGWWQRSAMMLLPIGLVFLILSTRAVYTFFLIAAVLPLLLTYIAQAQLFGGSLTHTFQQTRRWLAGQYGRAFGFILMLMMVGFLFYALLDTAILLFYLQFVTLFISLEDGDMNTLVLVIETFLTVSMIFLIVGFFLWGFGLFLFSNREIHTAEALRKRIHQINIQRRIRGLAKEDA